MEKVNHPKHYNNHPSGIECIDVAEHMGFNLGNALKYIWRADFKHNPIEDLQKAVWYIQREIAKRQKDLGTVPKGLQPTAANKQTKKAKKQYVRQH